VLKNCRAGTIPMSGLALLYKKRRNALPCMI
jgi:hypothetical protein